MISKNAKISKGHEFQGDTIFDHFSNYTFLHVMISIVIIIFQILMCICNRTDKTKA